ncbi:MAG: hypothetical protein K9M10_02215 [Candidatus Pacebacteria bacterium]|nr:hypothetical protein [Candidatus Paceibacterota bacterium]MCF7857275.1 hypothetical protein [Candidatus Paceibacterota bacterium]
MNTATEELFQMDTLQAKLMQESMRDLQITSGDVGKVFVLRNGEQAGEIITRESFATIPVFEIHAWVVVSEFDINTLD